MVVSFIGLETQEVAIKPNVKVVLSSDSQALEEVMVVAYGTAKKSSFTGSAGTMNADKIATRSVSNITNAMSGQVAGVQMTSDNGQPGESAKIRIRGIGSMASSNDPLYVVDGVPYDGDISSINPSDIESLTVLKDAAANAVSGADSQFSHAGQNLIKETNPNKKVIIDGLSGYMIADTEDVLMICPLNDENHIKEVIQQANKI